MAFEDIGPGPIDDEGVQHCIDPRFLPGDDPRRKFIQRWIRAGMPSIDAPGGVQPVENPT